MTSTLLLITILRIIPYALAGWYCYRKNYPRLLAASILGIFLAVLPAIGVTNDDILVPARSAFAFLFFWHTIDMQRRAPRVQINVRRSSDEL